MTVESVPMIGIDWANWPRPIGGFACRVDFPRSLNYTQTMWLGDHIANCQDKAKVLKAYSNCKAPSCEINNIRVAPAGLRKIILFTQGCGESISFIRNNDRWMKGWKKVRAKDKGKRWKVRGGKNQWIKKTATVYRHWHFKFIQLHLVEKGITNHRHWLYWKYIWVHFFSIIYL